MELLIWVTLACLNINWYQHQCDTVDINVTWYHSYYFPHSWSHRTEVYEEWDTYYIARNIEDCSVPKDIFNS